MHFQLTDDQRALRNGIREMLAGWFGRDRLRAAVDDPVLDRALWRELGAAGLFALRLPEAAGGVGLGLPEAVLTLEETGRVLLPGPVVACQLLAGVVAGVADGDRIVGLCDGAAEPVLWEHPEDCDELILLDSPDSLEGSGGAQGRTREAYRVCRSPAGQVARTPWTSVDPLTPLAAVITTTAVTASATATVTDPSRGAPLVAGLDVPRLRREAALLTAAQQLGSAARTVEMAVAHARERTQFGAPIGSFQAVKHLCAQMLVRTEIARSAVYAAAVTGDSLDIAGAKLLADEAAVRNARDCLQVHGGMGFTWEADVHLHLKRAWLRAERWGAAREAEERLAAGLIAGEAGTG
ncbi:putative acyl-CoA dehydrogenase [Streptomyces sp. NBRC 110611]|uniref:acyl-CoA dehydrogenase family protein n=1 Tax=Streptomyces sp. NBRC 110611 TaxID=1621259 RepID=UPI00082DE189|nr:acyl-CoA dehydrogenase family protein [Streptomyces sp. NBRC 110611]GAU67499.1 putative acyl-CoA dehydrogenase [Streptomyces sp. NBRC 110611]